MKNILNALEERGFIEAKTSDEIYQLVEKPLAVYVGFDPTSESLHLGTLWELWASHGFKNLAIFPLPLWGGPQG